MKNACVIPTFLAFLAASSIILQGCAQPPLLTTVRTPGTERIPLGIVIHPLFSIDTSHAWGGVTMIPKAVDRDRVYIASPAQTTLKITGNSQRLTSLVSMELASRGFKLRELPVEAPADNGAGGDRSAFAVSLALLDELREQHGVRAILIGNAFFARRPYQNDERVTDAYIKVVDVQTLDVMLQIGLPHSEEGHDMQEVATEIADRLAGEAGLPAVDE